MAKKDNKFSKYSLLWKRLHFKYRLTAKNENTLEDIWNIRVSIFSGVLLLLAFAVLVVFTTSFIIIATPIRYYLPGYLDSEVRKGAVHAAIQADSLEQQLRYQEVYINNLKNVFAETLSPDSVKKINIDTLDAGFNNPMLAKSENEKQFVKQYEEEEKYNLSVLSPAVVSTPTEGTLFFRPVQGVISQPFNVAIQRYGITIQTKNKENVLAVLEGTVIFSGYDINDRYIIQLQHKNGFVSIYKHLSILLKKTGDRVSAGEVVGVIDVNEDKSGKEHNLYFELWYRGVAVNPLDYISF